MGSFSDEQTISTYWWNKAEDLRNSAACIWSGSESPTKIAIGEHSFGSPSKSVYFMLCGMSLEAIFKAIIVEKNQQPPKTHNLSKLAALADVNFDTHENELLEILSGAIIWDGRYPVPLSEQEWDRHMKLQAAKLSDSKPIGENSKLMISTPNDELNWDRFSRFFDRASSNLFAIARWVMRD